MFILVKIKILFHFIMEHKHKPVSSVANVPNTIVERDGQGASSLSAVVLKGTNFNVKHVEKENTTDGYVYFSSKNKERIR